MSAPRDGGAGLASRQSGGILTLRSRSSSFAWQKRESCTPRSNSSSDFSSARSPSSSRLTIVSSSAIADSKSLIVGSISVLAAHVAVKFTFLQRDTHAIAGHHGGRVSDDCRAIGIPANCVSPREPPKGAEFLEPAGEERETRVRTVTG